MYLTLRRMEKPKLARIIMLIVRNRGVRFLRRSKENGNGDISEEFLYEVGTEEPRKDVVGPEGGSECEVYNNIF